MVFDFVNEVPRYKIEEAEDGLMIYFWQEAEETTSGVEAEMPVQPEPEPIKAEVEKEETVKPKPAPVKAEKETAKTLPETAETAVVQEQEEVENDDLRKVGFGIAVGYGYIQDDVFKEVYGKGVVFAQAELAYVLPLKARYIDIWTAVNYFEQDGKTTGFDEDTNLKITTFSLALRYLKKVKIFTPYVGIGLDYYSYKEILPVDFLFPSVGGSQVGIHIQGGCYFGVTPNLMAQLFIKYGSAKTNENDIEVDLGGLSLALGVAYRFNL